MSPWSKVSLIARTRQAITRLTEITCYFTFVDARLEIWLRCDGVRRPSPSSAWQSSSDAYTEAQRREYWVLHPMRYTALDRNSVSCIEHFTGSKFLLIMRKISAIPLHGLRLVTGHLTRVFSLHQLQQSSRQRSRRIWDS